MPSKAQVQITLFKKTSCVYCTRVHALLRLMTNHASRAAGYSCNIFRFKLIDISAEPAFAKTCIKLSGSFTVPQVFLNKELLGDANRFNCCLDKYKNNDCEVYQLLLKVTEEDLEKEIDAVCLPEAVEGFCSLIYDSLLSQAKEFLSLNEAERLQMSTDMTNFPPEPSAKFIKVTEDLAFSSQPTNEQLKSLKIFGFEQVINLTPDDSPFHNANEQNICEQQQLAYIHVHTMDLESILHIAKDHKTPCLIHSASGFRAGIIVLCICLSQLKISDPIKLRNTFRTWMKDLGLAPTKPNDKALVQQVETKFSM